MGIDFSTMLEETFIFNGCSKDMKSRLVFLDTNIFIAGGGISRSSDSGKSWVEVDKGINHSIAALAVSGQSLFAGTYNGGVYRSKDNGANWTAINTGLTDKRVHLLFVSDSCIFAGTYSAIFRSTDNGETWTSIVNA